MARTKTVPIRVNEQEMATFEAMAQLEKLPVGTFIRRRLLFEADRRGIVPGSGTMQTGLERDVTLGAVSKELHPT